MFYGYIVATRRQVENAARQGEVEGRGASGGAYGFCRVALTDESGDQRSLRVANSLTPV
jgi:hypothetical protein